MRASLFASATVTSRTGRRASTPRTHRPALLSQRVARQTIEVAPSTSSLRISALPAFVIPPRRVLPPVECCRGTRPSQAAKCRARLKAPMWSPTVAAIREAVIGPMPGIVARRRAVASWRAFYRQKMCPVTGNQIVGFGRNRGRHDHVILGIIFHYRELRYVVNKLGN